MTDTIDQRTDRGIWRHASQLPDVGSDAMITLGEGDTPLISLPDLARDLGIGALAGKAEHMNPTGSFKDRIAAVAMSLAVSNGLLGCLGTSSGNGGGAIAAYAARARRRSVLFTLASLPSDKLRQIRALGGEVYRVADLDYAAGLKELLTETVPALAREHGFLPFVTAFSIIPEAMEGTKTLAFELAESSFGATIVYVPVGGGGLLSGIHRGYLEAATKDGAAVPRLVGVQPSGCATLRRALSGEAAEVDHAATTVSGLQTAVLLDEEHAARAVRDTGGHAVNISDEEIWEAERLLARRGILVEAAGAAALAGAIADARTGWLGPDDRAVVVFSGAAWKDAGSFSRLVPPDDVPLTPRENIPRVLAGRD